MDYIKGKEYLDKGDFGNAIPLLEQAVDGGYYEALAILPALFMESNPKYFKPDKAYTYASLGVEKGVKICDTFLGICYYVGLGCTIDETKAQKLLGSEGKSWRMAGSTCFYRKQYSRAVKAWKIGADLGSSEAMGCLAMAYMHGCGCEKDYDLCLKYLEQAARQNPSQILDLCEFFVSNLLQEPNYDKAMEWAKIGEQKGDQSCTCLLAACRILKDDSKENIERVVSDLQEKLVFPQKEAIIALMFGFDLLHRYQDFPLYLLSQFDEHLQLFTEIMSWGTTQDEIALTTLKQKAEKYRTESQVLVGYNKAAYYLAKRGNFKEAHEFIDFAIEQDPWDMNLKDSKGEIYYLEGKVDKAHQIFMEIMNQDPNFYFESGQYSELYRYCCNDGCPIWVEPAVLNQVDLAQTKISTPPVLDIVVESITLNDDNANKVIDADENCTLNLTVANSGKADAVGCYLDFTLDGDSQGINAKRYTLPTIYAGESVSVKCPITSTHNTVDGNLKLGMSVVEPHGFGCDPVAISIETRAFVQPQIIVADYAITSKDGPALSRRVPFDLQLLVQNIAFGKAEDVTVTVKVPNNVYVLQGDLESNYTDIASGDTKEIALSLIVNNNYTASIIPIEVSLKEKYGKYAENRTIELQLNQNFAEHKIDIQGSGSSLPHSQISQASIPGKSQQSETDYNIPSATNKRNKTFALVIGNEKYVNEVPVPFATNDAQVVSQYFQSALGLPAENVHLLTNATRNQMIAEIDWLGKVAKAYNNDIEVLVYYSGHGMPDEATGASYLIPVDGYSSNTVTCYPTTQFYSELANLGAKSVTVMMDACFSGAQRGDGMLMAARGVAIKSKQDALTGQMVVMSASQGDETAFPYREKGHGMFTYYLLKHLQDHGGNTSLGDLYNYVQQQVSQRSIVVNNKPQTPQAMTSPSLADTWRSK